MTMASTITIVAGSAIGGSQGVDPLVRQARAATTRSRRIRAVQAGQMPAMSCRPRPRQDAIPKTKGYLK